MNLVHFRSWLWRWSDSNHRSRCWLRFKMTPGQIISQLQCAIDFCRRLQWQREETLGWENGRVTFGWMSKETRFIGQTERVRETEGKRESWLTMIDGNPCILEETERTWLTPSHVLQYITYACLAQPKAWMKRKGEGVCWFHPLSGAWRQVICQSLSLALRLSCLSDGRW